MIDRGGGRVVVVGAGPVGLTVALALSRHGFKVVILEANSGFEETARAVSFQPGTVQLFDKLGIIDDVLRVGEQINQFQFRELGGEVVADFNLDTLRDITPFPFKIFCRQDWFVRMLGEHVHANRIPIKFGVKVTDVHQNENGVRVRARRGQAIEILEADYVIGADGPASVTRRALQIAFDEQPRAVHLVQIMTTYDLERFLAGLLSEVYIMDPVSPFVLRNVLGCWYVLLPVPDEITSKTVLNNRWHFEALEKLFSIRAHIPKFRETMYSAKAGMAAEFRSGRGFLIGDAAHVIAPFSATGMNCGIHDAYALAEALHQEVQLGNAVFDAWAAERKTAIINAVAQSDALVSRLRAPEEERVERSNRIREIATSPESTRAYLLKSTMLEPQANPIAVNAPSNGVGS